MPENGPLIVQSDRTVLLEVAHPNAEDARHDLAVFAELERAPEHIHTYRITRLGLWNARAAGHTAEDMIATLTKYSRFAIPQSVIVDLTETVGRYGRLVIERADDGVLTLTAIDPHVLSEITRAKKVAELLFEKRGDHTYVVQAGHAASSSRSCSSSAGPLKTTPATPPARPTRSTSTRAPGTCARTSTRRSTTLPLMARVSLFFPVEQARLSSASAPWPRARRRPSSS